MSNKPDMSKAWADFGTAVEPNDTKKDQGWVAEKPPFQTFNWWQNRADHFMQHSNIEGIPVWDAVTIYVTGSIAKGSDGELYKALAASVNKNPVGNTTGEWRMVRTSFTGALTENASSQLVDNNVLTKINFGNIIHSYPGTTDISFDERLIVPLGAKFIKLMTSIRMSPNAQGDREIVFRKNNIFNGAGFGTKNEVGSSGSSDQVIQNFSAPIIATPGDYFEVEFFQNSGTQINILAQEAWFSMEILE